MSTTDTTLSTAGRELVSALAARHPEASELFEAVRAHTGVQARSLAGTNLLVDGFRLCVEQVAAIGTSRWATTTEDERENTLRILLDRVTLSFLFYLRERVHLVADEPGWEEEAAVDWASAGSLESYCEQVVRAIVTKALRSVLAELYALAIEMVEA